MSNARTGDQAERIAAVLRDDIITGRLKPDTVLRQEHLADRFKISRMPVRDALRLLEAEGLIDMPKNRGARVAALDPEGFREIFEMRATAEILALRNAVPNLSDRHLDKAIEIQNRIRTEPVSVFGDLNKRFHASLYKPCAWPRLLAHIDALADLSDRYLRVAIVELNYEGRSTAEHDALIDACRARDIDKACALLESHILVAGRTLYDHFRDRNCLDKPA